MPESIGVYYLMTMMLRTTVKSVPLSSFQKYHLRNSNVFFANH